jgi:tellurite resistance protein TerC
LIWTGVWIALALLFNVFVYFIYHHHLFGVGETIGHPLTGREAAIQFFNGWITEYSLSTDNLFIIAVIFNYFHVPRHRQHRVLVWGILGALLMRGAMIAAGAALIHRFAWITYVFGALLLLTAIKMLTAGDEAPEPGRNILVRLARKFFPVSPDYDGEKFFTRINSKRAITPLLVVLLVVESTDVLFAVDSIPAVFGITQDAFLVFTSNIFAILGLRSLFFVLAGLFDRFRYIKFSLVFIIAFIGVKMLLSHYYPIADEVALAVIVASLAIGVVGSLLIRASPE